MNQLDAHALSLPDDYVIFAEKIVENWPSHGKKTWLYIDEAGEAVWVPCFTPYLDDGTEGEPQRLPWLPLPGSQWAFLNCPSREALIHGNRGGGKSLALVMDFAQDCGRGYGEAWQGALCVRSYKGHDALAAMLEKAIGDHFGDKAKFHRSKGSYFAQWQTGETLYLRVLDSWRDYETTIRGRSLAWLGLDEGQLWESGELFEAALTVLRGTDSRVPKRARIGANPARRGHWLDKRFRITQGLDGVPHGPEGLEKVAIRSDLFENFILLSADPHYPESLLQSSHTKEAIASNLLGEWAVGSDGLFSDVWSDSTHIVPPLNLDDLRPGWRISRAYDHGSTAPFAVLWIAESDGSDAIFADGSRRPSVRGDLYVANEWYGAARADRPNVGLRLTVREIAAGILERESLMHRMIDAGPADASIFNDDYDRGARSLADEFAAFGVEFTKSSKGPRSAGYDLIRSLMAGSYADENGHRDSPGLFICGNCSWTLRLVPGAPRSEKKPDDVSASWPDHILDCLRYAVADSGAAIWRTGF